MTIHGITHTSHHIFTYQSLLLSEEMTKLIYFVENAGSLITPNQYGLVKPPIKGINFSFKNHGNETLLHNI